MFEEGFTQIVLLSLSNVIAKHPYTLTTRTHSVYSKLTYGVVTILNTGSSYKHRKDFGYVICKQSRILIDNYKHIHIYVDTMKGVYL